MMRSDSISTAVSEEPSRNGRHTSSAVTTCFKACRSGRSVRARSAAGSHVAMLTCTAPLRTAQLEIQNQTP
jgi:hypothetical protein